MGSGKESAPAKSSRAIASTQEAPTTPSYSDWSSSMQAYYGAGATPPPFFTSPVASPTPHPYVWGSQHLIPSYGTPLPYPTLYPHGGFYSHPNMATSQGATQTATEMEAKGPDGKDRISVKKSKGSSGNMVVGGKSGESGKAASGSGNDGASQSAESGSEDSSDASDENSNQQELASTKKRSFNQMLADGANVQNGNTAQNHGVAIESSLNSRGQTAGNLPVSVPGNPVGTMSATNLNIGMDLWNASSGAVPLRARPNASATMVGREGAVAEHLWVQDERELKKQKRKQSNRESARRSRLRKQAECEELQAKVETLRNENHKLNKELQKLSEKCEKLTGENASLEEELTKLYGNDAVSALKDSIANNDGANSIAQETSRENNSDSD